MMRKYFLSQKPWKSASSHFLLKIVGYIQICMNHNFFIVQENLFVIKLFFYFKKHTFLIISFIIISDLLQRAVGSPGCPTVSKKRILFYQLKLRRQDRSIQKSIVPSSHLLYLLWNDYQISAVRLFVMPFSLRILKVE